MAQNPRDAYKRGLEGRALSHWTEALVSSTPEERNEYERGIHDKALLDEVERREQVKNEPTIGDLMNAMREPYFSESESPRTSDDDDDGPVYAHRASPAPDVEVADTSSSHREPMSRPLGSKQERMAEQWSLSQIVEAWNRFAPDLRIENIGRLHDIAIERCERNESQGGSWALTLADYTICDAGPGIVSRYFSFHANKHQRLAWTFGRHHKFLIQRIREFIECGAIK